MLNVKSFIALTNGMLMLLCAFLFFLSNFFFLSKTKIEFPDEHFFYFVFYVIQSPFTILFTSSHLDNQPTQQSQWKDLSLYLSLISNFDFLRFIRIWAHRISTRHLCSIIFFFWGNDGGTNAHYYFDCVCTNGKKKGKYI